eukprot:TRINITY_DN6333_c0_g2_i7.p1 TRINITY_DN6333_c0_g2~~TRINITY_DN6333_c0_g2_i7.p1  ORF type:complete len:275 (+),score=79.96 TRINITY_DN6333_c0_g2_i7:299-1123(+)
MLISCFFFFFERHTISFFFPLVQVWKELGVEHSHTPLQKALFGDFNNRVVEFFEAESQKVGPKEEAHMTALQFMNELNNWDKYYNDQLSIHETLLDFVTKYEAGNLTVEVTQKLKESLARFKHPDILDLKLKNVISKLNAPVKEEFLDWKRIVKEAVKDKITMEQKKNKFKKEVERLKDEISDLERNDPEDSLTKEQELLDPTVVEDDSYLTEYQLNEKKDEPGYPTMKKLEEEGLANSQVQVVELSETVKILRKNIITLEKKKKKKKKKSTLR